MKLVTDFESSTILRHQPTGLTTEGTSGVTDARGTLSVPQRLAGSTTTSIDDSNPSHADTASQSWPGFGVGRAQGMVNQRRAISGTRLSALQTWTGYVTEVDGQTAVVRLTHEGADVPDLVGEFDLALLGDETVVPGDVVYVTSRTVLGQTGYPTHTTSLRLRRTGRWTSLEIAEIENRAQAVAEEMQGLID